MAYQRLIPGGPLVSGWSTARQAQLPGWGFLADTGSGSVPITINCTPGNAVAAGLAATVNQAHNLSCSVGDAVAAGVSAVVNQAFPLPCLVGNAVADGVAATITLGATIIVDCTPAVAVAAGIQAEINQAVNLACGVGNAVAAGLTATISLNETLTINCGVGNAVAAGVTLHQFSDAEMAEISERLLQDPVWILRLKIMMDAF